MKTHTELSQLAKISEMPTAAERQLPEPYRLVIVDSCQLFREGVAAILRQSCYEVVATAASIVNAHAQVGSVKAIDLLILGVDPQDSEKQFAALHLLRDQDTRTRTVLLLPACTAETLATVMLNRANGVILKDVSAQTLVATLDLVMRGQHVLPLAAAMQIFACLQPMRAAPATVPTSISAPPEEARVFGTAGQVTSKVVEAPGVQTTLQATRNFSLSDRETQILQCLVEGCANKLIARRLGIAEATVKVHIKGLLRKINVSNRTQAAIWALNQSVTTQSDQVSIPTDVDGKSDTPVRSPIHPLEDDASDVATIYPLAFSLMVPTHA